jgi:hypothetical protein
MWPDTAGGRFPIDPAILVAGIGLPDSGGVQYSEEIVRRIPEELSEAARELFAARCLVFAFLVNAGPEVRDAQLRSLASTENQATVQQTLRLVPGVQKLDASLRLPLFEIVQGTLTGMSPEQYQSFRRSVDDLVEADNQITMFEFFLRHHLVVHLDRRYGLLRPPRVHYKALSPLRDDICRLLAMLARVGHPDETEAVRAFEAALAALGVDWSGDLQRLGNRFGYADLATALQRLVESSPIIRKRVLTAAATAIMHDGQVTVEEAELFRAIAESLDSPVPPLTAGRTQQASV